MTKLQLLLAAIAGTVLITGVNAQSDLGDNRDLDDVRGWKIVKVETCLDAALDTIPGNPRKLEMKMEGDDPVYEFDVEAKDGNRYNIECNAEEGFIIEVERQVKADDPAFKSLAKITEADARKMALSVHPGTVVAMEREVSFDGEVTYEYDIQSPLGHEVKVDVDAVTGRIEEANIELYEIGNEQE